MAELLTVSRPFANYLHHHPDSLQSASMSDTLRAPLSAMVLLSYHLVLSHLIDSRMPDLAFCAQLLKPLAQRFPNVSLVYIRSKKNILPSEQFGIRGFYFWVHANFCWDLEVPH